MSIGQSFTTGNAMGIFQGVRALLSNPAFLAVAAPLAMVGGSLQAGANTVDQLRSFMITTQTGAYDVKGVRADARGIFSRLGLEPEAGLNMYGSFIKASGGRAMSQSELLAMTGITRSRDISPELLSQTSGFQRYSPTGGSGVDVVVGFERALQRLYPEDFKRKLVQLPEMMNVYNSLAHQMVYATGQVDSKTMTNFISSIQEGLGVEGINLQRHAQGMVRGFGRSSNNFTRMMQFGALREINPDISYQQALEIMEDPTKNPEYMRAFERRMRRMDPNTYRAWMSTMGLGAAESRKYYESGGFEEVFTSMQKRQDKTLPSMAESADKYYTEAREFQDTFKVFKDEIKDAIKSTAVDFAKSIEYFASGRFEREFSGLSSEAKKFILKSLVSH